MLSLNKKNIDAKGFSRFYPIPPVPRWRILVFVKVSSPSAAMI